MTANYGLTHFGLLKHELVGAKNMDVKTYLVSGFFMKGSTRQKFSTQARGLKKEDVIETVLSEIGGRFKVKRPKVNIEKVEEIKPET